MKIARIETFILGTGSSKDLLFCRVETDDGLYGWGEAYVTHGKESVVAECIRTMTPHLIGRSVFNIRHTGQVIFEDFAIKRGSPELFSAWSAVEIASWDILGKHTGLPVYNLIGGASRERVRIYANGWSRGATIDERVECGLKVKAMGFTAAKFDPFPGPWRNYVDRRDEDFAIDHVRAMRQALGPDFELLIEAHRRFAPAHAIRIGQRLVEFGIDWYEEPCLAENIDLVAEVRRCGADPDRDRRGAVHQGGVFRMPRQTRRRYSEPGHLRCRRHFRDARHCRDGAAAGGRDGPAQLQQHPGRPGRDRTSVGGDPEFPDRRVFRQLPGSVPRDRDRVADASRTAGSICRPRPDWASTSMSINCARTRITRRPPTASANTGRNTPGKTTPPASAAEWSGIIHNAASGMLSARAAASSRPSLLASSTGSPCPRW